MRALALLLLWSVLLNTALWRRPDGDGTPWRAVMVSPLMLAQHELASREAASRAVSCVIEVLAAARAAAAVVLVGGPSLLTLDGIGDGKRDRSSSRAQRAARHSATAAAAVGTTDLSATPSLAHASPTVLSASGSKAHVATRRSDGVQTTACKASAALAVWRRRPLRRLDEYEEHSASSLPQMSHYSDEALVNGQEGLRPSAP